MGQAKYDIADIKYRITKKAAYSPDELAAILESDRPARLDFMIMNNPANVNETLKYKLGDNSLPFAPNSKAITAHVDILVKKDDQNELAVIEKNFVFNPYAENATTGPELVSELKKYFPNWFK